MRLKEKNAKKSLKSILELFALNYPNGAVRQVALMELSGFFGQEAKPVFEKATKDFDWIVRQMLVNILGDVKLFSLLKQISEKDPNGDVRKTALKRLIVG